MRVFNSVTASHWLAGARADLTPPIPVIPDRRRATAGAPTSGSRASVARRLATSLGATVSLSARG